LIISDYVMPEIKGDEFLKLAHEKIPDTNKIMLTGQATIEGVSNAINWANLYRYIGKPWEVNDLILTIKEALNSYYKDKKLEDQNKKLIEINQNLEIKVQERTKEVIDKNKILEEQKNKLNELYKDLSDSVRYAKRIQTALLPCEDYINKVLKENFIYFKPKDVVSGDFYWVKEIGDHIIISVADCTGHGVPGGFMSMLGISFLNEVVKRQEINTTAQVLEEMRQYIISCMQQHGAFGEQKDGMDISLIEIDKNSLKAQYSGANNPIYIYRINTNILEEIKPDKMPIGIHLKMDSFTNHQFQLNKGDIIYMFSDGFADQFGGEKGKKYKYKTFRELLLNNANEDMGKQLAFIENEFNSWRGDFEQIDDVTIFGIKIL